MTGRCQSRAGGYWRCQYFWQFLPITSNGGISFADDGSRHEWGKDFDGFSSFCYFTSLGHPIFWTFFLSFAKGNTTRILDITYTIYFPLFSISKNIF